MNRRRRPDDGETLGDRLVAAAFGFVVGAAFGFAIALLLTGTSHYIDVGEFDPPFALWTVGTGLVCAVLGLLLGSRAAEWLGGAISAVWTAEALAYWWYWPLRAIGVVFLIGLGVGFVKQFFK